MTREIKFRYLIRNRKTKEIELKIFTLNQIQGAELVYLDENFLKIISRDEFTGLKDKNGVDIFEGDIVKREGGIEPIFEVKWNMDNCSFNLIKIDEFKDNYDIKHYSSNNALMEMEVIGNIHENPELLK